jgi:exodeoxyribonuclease V beta subunit
MSAQRSIAVAQRATLLTNWRSTPEVVRAVNAIFSNRRTDAFVFGDAIGFAPSTAADKRHTYLVDGRAEQPALTLWRLPLDDGDAPPAKDKAGQWARAAVADEIVRLLSGARRGQVRLVERTGKRGIKGERPLEPGDIAILVRTRREGAALRRLLATRGVAALSVERASVYESDEAEALERLLTAVLTPRDRRSTRAALAVPLLGLDYVAMASIAADDEAWAAFVDWLLALRAAWQRRGFMAMFQCLLWQPGPRGRTVSEVLADGLDAERRLTNLLHLGELLQQASREHAGLDALIGWFRLQRDARRGEGAADELQLRLESDANLVQIVTVHSAKGLQYPVVFLPDLWNPRTTAANQPLAFHRDGPAGPQACLDIGSDDRDTHLLLAERERLAEDVRLAYVALTRAESAVYLVWGRAGSAKHGSDSGRSALAWLLHPHQDAAALLHRPPDAFGSDGETPADLDGELNALAEAAPGSIAVTALPQSGLGLALPRAETGLEPTLARFQGRIARNWRITSFSALARNLAEHPRASAEAVDGTAVRVDDEPPVADLEAVAGLLGEPSSRTGAEVDAAIDAQDHSGASAEAAVADPVLSFPAGSDVGTFLHLLLEHLDFGGDVRGQVIDLSARFAARFGLDHRRHAGAAALMMERTLQTPISEDGFRLADLPATHRLNELAFDLATDHADIGALNRLLEANAGFTLPALLADDFAGMVTGVIDLVFEHAGRFYVADYKSNRLGRRFDDYAPAARSRWRCWPPLRPAVPALHPGPAPLPERTAAGLRLRSAHGRRLLSVPARHAPETGAQRGVFFTRPESGLIRRWIETSFPGRAVPEFEPKKTVDRGAICK